MKLPFKTAVIFLLFTFETDYSQTDYSLAITFGYGINFFENQNTIDKNHFRTNKPLSPYFGARLLKNLDEENKLFADFLITRKKIQYRYDLSEPDIPFINKENFGQKYDCISFFVGYRKLFPMNEKSLYFEASVGADYNNSVVIYNEGTGESQSGLSETVYFQNFYYANLGEKSYTISSNVGFGVNFGYRNQYDIGLSMNIPFQKIQTKESHYQYTWNYRTQEYIHDLKYVGRIYYPSLRLTYYAF